MPEEIVSRILRLPGYGIYGWETDEAANTLILSIRQTAGAPYYVCGGCGISGREIHSWTERRIRDLGGVLPARGRGPRAHPGQALAAAAALGEPGLGGTPNPARPLHPQPPAGQSLPAQGAAGPALDLHLRGCSPPLPHQLAPGAPVATVAGLPEARPNVDAASGRYPELLPREGPLRESRSDQRQHPRDAAAGPGLPGSRVFPAQGLEGHRDAPSSSDRMNTGPATDSGEDRINVSGSFLLLTLTAPPGFKFGGCFDPGPNFL